MAFLFQIFGAIEEDSNIGFPQGAAHGAVNVRFHSEQIS